MAGWAERIRAFIMNRFGRLGDRATVLLAVAAVVSGLILGFVSLIPDIQPAGTRALTGTLAAFSERNESFVSDTGLSELRLVNGACAIFVTALNEAQLHDFNATGNRPEPQLACDRRIATFEYPLRWVIIENRGSSDQAYDISARFLIVRSPWGLLAIPGLPLVLGGTVYLILRSLRRGIGQIQEQLRKEHEERKR